MRITRMVKFSPIEEILLYEYLTTQRQSQNISPVEWQYLRMCEDNVNGFQCPHGHVYFQTGPKNWQTPELKSIQAYFRKRGLFKGKLYFQPESIRHRC